MLTAPQMVPPHRRVEDAECTERRGRAQEADVANQRQRRDQHSHRNHDPRIARIRVSASAKVLVVMEPV